MSSFDRPVAPPKPATIAHPKTLAEAANLLTKTESVHVISGGTDVVPLLREGLLNPELLISLRKVQGLDAIAQDGDVLRLGARTTLFQLASDKRLSTAAAALAQAADLAATPQVRNMATLGGNLLQRPRCWYFRGGFDCLKKGGKTCFAVEGESEHHAILGGGPCYIVHPSDPASALVALGARIHLLSGRGPRDLALEAFFALPEVDVTRENTLARDELVEAVSFAPLARGDRSVFFKIGRRADFTFATVNVAVVRRGDQTRVVLGGVAPVPWRAKPAEAELAGKPLTPDLARRAAKAALANAKPLKDNAYKVPLAESLIERALVSMIG